MDRPTKMVTAALLDSLITKAELTGERHDLNDSEVPNLVIRIGTGGRETVSYSLRYRTGGRDSKKQSYPLKTDRNTTLAQAREQANELRSLTKRKIDPHERDREAEKAKADAKLAEERELTFAQLAEKWLTEYASEFRKAATVQIDKYRLNKDILPTIGTIKARDVQRSDIERVAVEGVKRGAKISSNRTVELVRAIMRYGIKVGCVTTDPTEGFQMKGKEKARSRALSDEEIVTLWNKLGECQMSGAMRTIIRMELLTGQRSGNVAGAEIKEFDMRRGLWAIPWEKVKGREEKDGPHLVPMSDALTKIVIEAIQSSGGGRYLFPSPRGSGKNCITSNAVSRAMRRARGDFGFEKNANAHDFRRTIGTGLAGMKVAKHVIAHILAHREVTHATVLDLHYNQHDYLDEKREALEVWGAHVTELLAAQSPAEPQAENIVNMRRTA